MTSSARFKDEIKPMDNASEALFSLKPVAFRYKRRLIRKVHLNSGLWPRTWKR